ncbi:MAG: FAD-binding protein [Candidatus Heimdallarchaeota archaeon]|nr:FAD-binding protein [Candidatus Heimdallarchaeota archaeon]MCK4876901.1 FAD-binding protein [Candidatus Heimdallarchaeota archaeon]
MKFDYTYDLVIVGSGGGGLTAALVAKHLGLDVLVIEKTEFYGGSTALSGGGMWVPNNFLLEKAGIIDSYEKAMRYMASIVGDRVQVEKQEAFLKEAPKMIEWLRDFASMKFLHVKDYSDYHPDEPGGIAEGRGLECKPFNGRKLKRDFSLLRPPTIEAPLGIAFTISDYHDLGMVTSTWKGKYVALKIGFKTIFNLIFGVKYLTLGRALVARLRYAMKKKDIPLWVEVPFKILISENDKIVGIIAEKENKEIKIEAKKGVLLAAGGFPCNSEMREKYLPSPTSIKWSSASPGNTGDAILEGIRIGAAVDLMDDAWWGPSSVPPEEPVFFHVGERGYPGGIMVNKEGKRFTNEAASYVVVVHDMYEKHTKENSHIPSYFIFDQRFKDKYMFGLAFPGMKFPQKYYDTGYMKKAESIVLLAKSIGVNEKNLEKTIDQYNEYALSGKDLDFSKGNNAYDNFYGDPKVKPNPNLAPLEKPPYYAVEFYPGDLGTKGGLVTNEHAQVLREDGSIIEGLYATGNSMASVMGNTYPGPGSPVCSTMTFGYIAALHIAKKE